VDSTAGLGTIRMSPLNLTSAAGMLAPRRDPSGLAAKAGGRNLKPRAYLLV